MSLESFVPQRSFFEASATQVAPRLLGAILSHDTERGRVSIRLTEVEAYMGDGTDPGSHAHRGKTNRNATMFGEAAHLYAYFTYGMHTCANVACSPEGIASGVLLRAGEIVEGVELARDRRGRHVADARLARGPANLVVSLGIVLAQNGADLLAPPFTLSILTDQVAFSAGPRTGLSMPGGGDEFPWRYWMPGDATVSPYKRHVGKRRAP
ncbi:DNA-3-methyladenine glycosylase [Leifsonia sp. Root112D2]|uniref:DNA-3-methyladenine glycosylase n=1 Tax=Leifsonia sp. Root112D2 TaxID=1736426 RepID=UPI0007020833|nr:DNA-3-methyladenine glycosylase [Leifsonia sp. Root112D2]KQV05069.1 DNA-3-methyladenine glycosidase [Leifsonia sp. Root112D2]